MAEPEKTFHYGCCSAAIFANEIEQDGKKAVIKKATIHKRYMNKEGNWQSSNSFGVNDLPKLALAENKAYEYLPGKRE